MFVLSQSFLWKKEIPAQGGDDIERLERIQAWQSNVKRQWLDLLEQTGVLQLLHCRRAHALVDVEQSNRLTTLLGAAKVEVGDIDLSAAQNGSQRADGVSLLAI